MTETKQITGEYRFAGHQTFPLRTAWLPKAAPLLRNGFDPLSDIVDGVVKLGLGKNMVEALRCWMSAYGVAERTAAGWQLTGDGEDLFGRGGLDPFLNRWLEPTFTSSPRVR